MKITKTRLREIIKEELLNEFTTTSGGTKSTEKVKSANVDTRKKRGTYNQKTRAYNTADTAWSSAVATRDTAEAEKNKKYQALQLMTNFKYRKANPRMRGSWLYRSTSAPGYSVNPEWSTKSSEYMSANTIYKDANTDADDKAAERTTASGERKVALANMSAAEKAEKAAKAATHFGYSAGAGGRVGGKGGTAKSSGKKGSGKKKNESLQKIIGNDLIKELNDIEKYK